MKTFSCVIADDEPLARELITGYVERVPFLDCKAVFSNAWEIKEYLDHHQVDLLLIDIEMPALDGLTFIKSYAVQPKVIFITAHRQYAVEAFEVKALDYLLKPVSFDRFLKAVNEIENISKAQAKKDYIFVTVERQQQKLMLQDILFIEARGDYLRFVLEEGPPIISKMTLKSAMTALPDSFIQIHRSFLINKEKVVAFQKEKLKVGGEWLKISRSFKGQIQID